MVKEVGNVKTTGAPVLKQGIIACGRVVLDATPKIVEVPNVVKDTDVVVSSLVTDDTGAPIGLIETEIVADGQIQFTGATITTGDGVVDYMVLRQD
jgi:hypothetical protein